MLWLAADALAARPTELVLWHAYRGDEKAALEQVAQAWTARTGIDVQIVDLPFGAFDGKVETAIPRGNGPDVLVSNHANLGKWVAMGLLEPWTLPLTGQRPITVDALRLDGKTWGAPIAFKSVVLLYDPTRVSTPPRTTDELLAQAHALSADGGFGLAYQATEPYFAAPWIHAFGSRAIGDDGTVDLDTPAFAAALAFSKRLAVDEGIAPQQPTAELVTRLYREGQVPFVISGPWFVAEVDRPIAAAPLPIVSDTGRPAAPYLTVDAAFVATHRDHPAEAADLAAFVAGFEGAAIREEVGHQAVSLVGPPSDGRSELQGGDPLLAVLATQARDAVPMPSDPDVQNAFEAQARALRDVLRGAATPEQAAAAAQAYYAILSKPPPDAVSAWPYVGLLGLVAVGWVAWRVAPLRRKDARDAVIASRWDYPWVAPSLLSLLALVVAPFVVGASVSLLEHHRGEWSFVGLANFADILLSRDFPVTSPLSFWFTLLVTVAWTVANVALHVTIGFALALVLREPWIRLRAVWRALLVIPWAIPNYITALIWKGMFHAQYGAVNALLGLVLLRDGPIALDWFSSFSTAFAANLATNTWLGFPFMMVVILGALQAVPRDLEEAAEIDGASYWFRVRHVIWPLVRPALLPAVVLGTIWTFNLFNVVFLVSQGEPNGATEILVSEVYRWAFSRGNRYGYASAYAVIVFGVLVLYSRGTQRMLARQGGR
jgi:arabinogalactan oligomer/maltooligosaccharide transport system permease protein